MDTLPSHANNFVAVSHFEAIYKTDLAEQVVLFESRTHDLQRELFTIINQQVVRATSLHDFVIKDANCLSLTLYHQVGVMWNGADVVATLKEEFVSAKDDHMAPVHVRLSLTVGDVTLESEECDTFSDAVSEMKDLTEDTVVWSLKTCHHCKYSWPALRTPCSDRDELQCYRDTPEAFAEIRQKGKFVSNEIYFAGAYFVDVFHTCSAWRGR